ncbi:P63C domain-containing protein [Rufibacter immobilis]|uniref:P63C domain-containing protein n=1 Tax=Rufibacter immobilis TaxID=1348778 RepID=UPI0035EACE88
MNRRKIEFEGVLDLIGTEIPCYVLDDGTRVLSGRGMQDALKLVDEAPPKSGQKPGTRLARLFENKTLNPFIFNNLEQDHFSPIICYKGNTKINGFEATVLADICDGILEARKQGARLTERQKTIADQCEMLVRAFARIGIIALVDEATGYQYKREKDELQNILKLYVSPDILDWQKTFHDNFYKEIFRLKKWDFTVNGIKNRPGVVGTYTKQFIYNLLPKGVVDAIKIKTPKSKGGHYLYRWHQSLTPDVGKEHLRNQIIAVTTLMNISRSWEEFKRFFERKYGQIEIDFNESPNDKKNNEPLSRFDASLKGLLGTPPPKKDKGDNEENEDEKGTDTNKKGDR